MIIVYEQPESNFMEHPKRFLHDRHRREFLHPNSNDCFIAKGFPFSRCVSIGPSKQFHTDEGWIATFFNMVNHADALSR